MPALRKYLLFFWPCAIWLFHPALLLAQHNVRFVVTERTAIKHDRIYLSGSFNNWDSTANATYRLQPSENGAKSLTLQLPAGKYEYKITRGNWLTVEKDSWGLEIANHVITVSRDTVVHHTVEAWRDQIITDKWQALANAREDTAKVFLLTQLANIYGYYPEWYNADSALFYVRKTLLLLQAIKTSMEFKAWTAQQYVGRFIDLQEMAASLLHAFGNYSKALELRLKILQLAQTENNPFVMVRVLDGVTKEYIAMHDYANALIYGKRLLKGPVLPPSGADYLAWRGSLTLADVYYYNGKLDSALFFSRKAYELSEKLTAFYQKVFAPQQLGDIYAKLHNHSLAFVYYRETMTLAAKNRDLAALAKVQQSMASLFEQSGVPDSALYYAKHAFAMVQGEPADVKAWGENPDDFLLITAPLIARLYNQKKQNDSAYKYLKFSLDIRDRLYNAEKLREFQNVSFNESIRQQQQAQEVKAKQQAYETRMKLYGLAFGMLVLLIVAGLLIRNNRNKQKAYTLVQHQKVETERAYEQLKAAQNQLVQQEKMASLGELTAGIAHEIQNPLNFVNNFAAVNKELLSEMRDEIEKGNFEGVKGIAGDLEANEEKISHHGKRADSIVKGMLQHARAGTGRKELTDINQLADEYLRLSFQGMRAKDKTFTANIETHFDTSLSTIRAVPQDIGRVLLNLFNNAFYAVREKQKSLNGQYDPKVEVSSKGEGDHVLIIVKDNGVGMSPKVAEKVFQPFFTTKPTGEGTGLGLSLSYDIVTKGHGGELKVGTKEGEGSEFIVQLPNSGQQSNGLQ